MDNSQYIDVTSMQKRLTKHGNSYALVIDWAILDLLKIKPTTMLDVSTDGKNIILQPKGEKDDETHEELIPFLADVNNRYGEILKRLA